MQQNNTKRYQFLRTELLKKRTQLSSAEHQLRSTALNEHFLAWLSSLEYETQQDEEFVAPKTLPARHKIRRQGLVIAAFWPYRDEPDIRPLLEELHAMGHEIILPKVIQKNAPLEFFYWDPGAPMVKGHYGILEPEAKEIGEMPDIVLLPMLGYGDNGERLGYGGGYYDRTIAQWEEQGHEPLFIGAVWSEAHLGCEYECLPHDKPLDAIVSEKGVSFF